MPTLMAMKALHIANVAAPLTLLGTGTGWRFFLSFPPAISFLAILIAELSMPPSARQTRQEWLLDPFLWLLAMSHCGRNVAP